MQRLRERQGPSRRGAGRLRRRSRPPSGGRRRSTRGREVARDGDDRAAPRLTRLRVAGTPPPMRPSGQTFPRRRSHRRQPCCRSAHRSVDRRPGSEDRIVRRTPPSQTPAARSRDTSETTSRASQQVRMPGGGRSSAGQGDRGPTDRAVKYPMSRRRHPQRVPIRARRGHPTTCHAITGAEGLPQTLFTPVNGTPGPVLEGPIPVEQNAAPRSPGGRAECRPARSALWTGYLVRDVPRVMRAPPAVSTHETTCCSGRRGDEETRRRGDGETGREVERETRLELATFCLGSRRSAN